MDTTNPPGKRARAPSGSSSSGPTKASRIIPASMSQPTDESSALVTNHPLLCSLPPTCHRNPTPIANTNELEKHYAMYHAHVCELDRCGCVFNDGRLLELHQTECHDPLAALRKDRGEKIFQCHIPAPACGRNFHTPKARRLHLIQSHGYPKEYFFAVTNKGIGGLLKKWGEGASMIRREWKPRETKDTHRKMDEDDDDDEDEDEDEADEIEEEEEEGEEDADLEATPRMLPRATIHSPQSSVSSSKTNRHNDASIAGLADSMESLSLVPDSVRFGRGGKNSGFGPDRATHRGRARGRDYRGGITTTYTQHHLEVNTPPHQESGHEAKTRGRGRGARRPMRARGRGRGREFAPF